MYLMPSVAQLQINDNSGALTLVGRPRRVSELFIMTETLANSSPKTVGMTGTIYI